MGMASLGRLNENSGVVLQVTTHGSIQEYTIVHKSMQEYTRIIMNLKYICTYIRRCTKINLYEDTQSYMNKLDNSEI